MFKKGEKKIIYYFGKKKISDTLEFLLKSYGYAVDSLSEDLDITSRMEGEEAVLLLLNLEGETDSFLQMVRILGEVRIGCKKPIIALMEKDRDAMSVFALNAGADDVVYAEESEMVSMARIQAQLRSYERLVNRAQKEEKLCMEDLEVDDGSKRVSVKGQQIKLTPTEYKILHVLLERPGKVMSNEQIYKKVWKMEPIGADNTVAVHIRHIREKIEENPQDPRYIQVVWGQGYKVG